MKVWAWGVRLSVQEVISKVSYHYLSSNSNGIRYISEALIEQRRLCITGGDPIRKPNEVWVIVDSVVSLSELNVSER